MTSAAFRADYKRFRHDYESTPEGLVFPKMGVLISGVYHHSVNGQDEQADKNLLPDAAILSILDVYFGDAAKINAWYLALYAGAVSPAANWTAANFAANATEITSNTEGYTELTRPQWVPSAAASGAKNNLTQKAKFTIATASSLTVNGAALLSSNVKGGTGGVLASAARFANPRTLFNDDTFEVGYTVTLTS